MKIGLIGLGDIAKKAYLPVLTIRNDIELICCTRNDEVLKNIVTQYRLSEGVHSVDELIAKGIEAAFISVATEAHADIAKQLISSGINVYIDKPISMNLEETEEIIRLAKEKGVIAMVGFNRRFAPMIRELPAKGKADLILIQKNRFHSSDIIRRAVVEDFIHVVDTLLFLLQREVKDVQVQYKTEKGRLKNVVIELIADGATAVGIMNRDNGTTEEIIEYMMSDHKYVVNNLTETQYYTNSIMSLSKFNDWDPTLYRRGFYGIVDHFITSVRDKTQCDPSLEDSLITHRICETITNRIEAGF